MFDCIHRSLADLRDPGARAPSAAVDPGGHAVLLVDQPGWYTTAKLGLPQNIAILPLPAKGSRIELRRQCLAVHA